MNMSISITSDEFKARAERLQEHIQAEELGGFRHSDTLLVTEDGIEVMTYYPRDIDSLTLPG